MCSVAVRSLFRSIDDWVRGGMVEPDTEYAVRARSAWAELLGDLAVAVRAFGALLRAEVVGDATEEEAALGDALDRLRLDRVRHAGPPARRPARAPGPVGGRQRARRPRRPDAAGARLGHARAAVGGPAAGGRGPPPSGGAVRAPAARPPGPRAPPGRTHPPPDPTAPAAGAAPGPRTPRAPRRAAQCADAGRPAVTGAVGFSLNGSQPRATGYRAPLMRVSAHGPPRRWPRGVRPGGPRHTAPAPVTAARRSEADPTGGWTPGPGTTSSIEEVGQ